MSNKPLVMEINFYEISFSYLKHKNVFFYKLFETVLTKIKIVLAYKKICYIICYFLRNDILFKT